MAALCVGSALCERDSMHAPCMFCELCFYLVPILDCSKSLIIARQLRLTPTNPAASLTNTRRFPPVSGDWLPALCDAWFDNILKQQQYFLYATWD